MTDTTTNSEALDSTIYNPQYDQTDLDIYNIISNNMSTDTYNKILTQYTNMWNNLSTVNQYEGALSNPIYCDTNDTNSDIDDIFDSIKNLNIATTDPDYGAIADPNSRNSIFSQLTGGNSTTSNVSADNVLSAGDGFLNPNGDGSYTLTNYTNNNAVQPNINKASNYIDKIIANLPMMLAMAQLSMGILTSLDGLSNPCISLPNFFGVINGVASKVMAKIKSAIAEVKKFIDGGIEIIRAALNEINDLMGQILSDINDLVTQIDKEISNFIKSLIDSAKIGLSGFLKSIKLDPCAKSILKSLGSPATLFAL